ncbi:MAG: YgiT-type zinc finger protein [Phycisphaerae bacterium]|nr:YgiT-type zinc finger protein [Phycisphaerae bacterium]
MMDYDYGKCHVCGGRMEERLTNQSFEEAGEWVLIRSVPTGVCIRCGEQIFRANVLERLEQIRQERKLREPEVHIEVPVFAF